EITCPDCGKVIAPEGAIADKLRCRCGEESAKKQTAVAPRPTKSCYVCGANLEGKKRLKDHLGRYWCKSCAEADERAKKHAGEVRCAECSRLFPEHKLVFFQTDRVCQTCFREREKALEKKISKAAGQKIQKTEEINKIKWMAIVVAVLLGLAFLFQFVFR
ncbi:MAG TPA: hypothetical protein VF669_16155, partial [Tepidisphaeraceae bacterium]